MAAMLLNPSGSKSDDSRSPTPWTSTDPWAAPPGPDTHDPGIYAPQSLSAAVRGRKDEYVRKKTMKVKVGSWNVASISGTEKDLSAWFIHGLGVKGRSQDL